MRNTRPRGSTHEVIAMHEDDEHTQSTRRKPARKSGEDPPSRPPAARIKLAPNPRLSRSLEYGIAILEAFSSEYPTLGIAEMADIVGISRSTTHRYAITLVALGYLEQDDKRKYRLSAYAAGPGSAMIGHIRRQAPARVALEELREEIGYTVSMGVLDGTRIIYVHRLLGHRPGQHAIDMDLGVGGHIPVYCTAMGKVLLASISDAQRRELLAGLDLVPQGPRSITVQSKLTAELDRISTREAVVSDEELAPGSRSIAVLVPRPASEHPLAIEVTVPSQDYTVDRLLEDIGPRLKRTARLISGE
jgi:DNA-binding IclR family transcriptional regulator